ncbi:Exported protein [Nitrospira sp. ND1]|jgi:hypothetical protein|nr:Exported protein [Nitrospira sp. ND1]
MRIVDIRSHVFGYSVMLLLSMSTVAWAEEPPQSMSGEGQARGVVIGIVGTPVRIVSPAITSSGVLSVGDVISAGEELRVGTGEQVTLLWDHRAVLTLNEGARMNVQELHRGQTELLLPQGKVRIALSYNAGRMTDTLTLWTPLARVVSRGGIMEATVLGGERQSRLARLVTAPPGDTLRVLEGQARVEPLTGDRKAFSLKAGTEFALRSGMVTSLSELQEGSHVPQPLAVREEHRALPSPVTRQIVGTQVGHALELEKEIRQASSAGGEKELPGPSTKGTILATSIALPVVTFSQTPSQVSVSGTSTGVPTVLPPPAVPPVQSAGVGSSGLAQSGGLNSSRLLQEILTEVGKIGKGHGKKDR